MKYFIITLLVLLCGCTKRVEGPAKSEYGEIYDTCFVPKGHGSGTGWSYGKNGGPVTTQVDIPERYAVVFKCEHGKFVIDDDRAKSLYSRFSKGDKVKIIYCIVSEVTKESTNAVDLHFIDAYKVTTINAEKNP